VKNVSASQLKLYQECQARWGYRYLEGIKEPDTKETDFGKDVHKEMELYLKYGTIPTSKHARLLAEKYAPAPFIAETEVPISFRTEDSSWLGFIDVAVGLDADGNYCPVEPGKTVMLIDWKTTGSIRNAKSVKELEEDVAANLYAYEAYLGGASSVIGMWVYIERGEQPHHKAVTFALPKLRVLDTVARLNSEAGEIQTLYQLKPKVDTLKKNKDYCFAFKKQCPHISYCKPNRSAFTVRSEPMPTFEEEMNNKFATNETSVTPAPKKIPPPPPKRPMPPGFTPVEPTKAESGFVNPPGVPEKLPLSSDELAKHQGRDQEETAATEASGQTVDDLDAMSLPDLKALATALGIELTPRHRKNRLIEDIRLKRQLAAESHELTEDEVFQAEKTELKNRAEAARKEVEAITDNANDSFPDQSESEPAHVGLPNHCDDTGKVDEVLIGIRTLYINCRPDKCLSVISFSNLLRTVLEDLMGNGVMVVDYRSVEYGKGAGIVADALNKELSTFGFQSLFVDTRTREGQDFVSLLERHSSKVVRGF